MTYLPVRQDGLLDLKLLEESIRPDTVLVSVMAVNNEIGAPLYRFGRAARKEGGRVNDARCQSAARPLSTRRWLFDDDACVWCAGVVQPLKEIGALCRERGVFLHTDAAQAVGKIPINVNDLKARSRCCVLLCSALLPGGTSACHLGWTTFAHAQRSGLGASAPRRLLRLERARRETACGMAWCGMGAQVDLMSISGHKLYSPKGIGAIYIRRRPRVRIEALMSGGGQERGLRSGTVPTPLVVGLGAACDVAQRVRRPARPALSLLSWRSSSTGRKSAALRASRRGAVGPGGRDRIG